MIINGQDQDIRGDVPTNNAIWDRYHSALTELFGARLSASKIMTEGFITGCLDTELTSKLVDMAESAQPVLFKADDAINDFAFTPSVTEYEDAINADHQHLALTPEMLWQANELAETLDPIIQDALGTPWRLLNVRIWKTPASNTNVPREGSLAWHDDGMPRNMLKLLVYLTDLSPETGTVEWKISKDESTCLEGPAGSWLLFQNSVVFHRGIPPTKPGMHRILLELTLTPSAVNQITAVHGGYNARHPWRFWQTDLR